jgi:pre-mRNA-splicing factor 38B
LHARLCRYIRGVGFLYLRYCCPPKQLWDWFEPYLDDDEPLKVGWGKNSPEMYVRKWTIITVH